MQDRIAVCTYVRSRNTEPRLVALMAAQEIKDEYGEQVRELCRHASLLCTRHADPVQDCRARTAAAAILSPALWKALRWSRMGMSRWA